MSKNTKLVLQLLSFIIFPVGIYLYFTTKNKQEAQLYGILALLSFIIVAFTAYTCTC